jgi:hypothetical protein
MDGVNRVSFNNNNADRVNGCFQRPSSDLASCQGCVIPTKNNTIKYTCIRKKRCLDFFFILFGQHGTHEQTMERHIDVGQHRAIDIMSHNKNIQKYDRYHT